MPGITSDFIERLKTNGREARVMSLTAGAVGGVAGVAGVHGWFYFKVRNGGAWDLKNNVYKKYKTTGVDIGGRHYANDMPGNFHYGFVGRAAGFPTAELNWIAGKAQKRAGTSRPEFEYTFGDDPEDYEFIRLGAKLYDSSGIEFTEADLKQVLAEFSPPVCTTK